MGRFLVNGLLTTISIRKRKSNWYTDNNFSIKEQYENIIEEMNKIIDTSKYDVVESDNRYDFHLKLDFINENIYDLLEEMEYITPTKYIFEDLYNVKPTEVDYESKDYKDKYPLICSINENGNYAFVSDNNEKAEFTIFGNFNWIFNSKYLANNIDVYGAVIIIWQDFYKYDGEYEGAI